MLNKFNTIIALTLCSSLFSAHANEVGLTAGEFRVDESGAATYQLAIDLPTGRGGVTPQLGLSYSSNNQLTGALGVGWSFSGVSSISRCPMTPIYDNDIREITFTDGTDSDGRGLDKYCLDGQRLILIEGEYGASGSTYRTEIDNFSLITAHGQATESGPLYFTVENKAGETHYYGDVSNESRVNSALSNEGLSSSDAFVEQGGYVEGSVAKAWSIKVIKDVVDNFIVFNYEKPIDAQTYKNQGRFNLKNIKYTGNLNKGSSTYASVDITYQHNEKSFSGYYAGTYVHRDSLINKITVTIDGEHYRTYTPEYENSDIIEERILLKSLKECSDAAQRNCLPATKFDWLRPSLKSNNIANYTTLDHETIVQSDAGVNGSTQVFDINGDGFQDLVYAKDKFWYVRLGQEFSFGNAQKLSGIGAKKPQYALNIDYNGDGVRDLLVASGPSKNWHALTFVSSTSTTNYCDKEGGGCDNYKTGSSLRTFEEQNLGIMATGLEGESQIMDVNGDGFEDIVFRFRNEIKAYLNSGSGSADTSFDEVTILYSFDDFLDRVDFNEGFHSQTASMKSATGIDINGDGRTDLITKVTIDSSYCSRSRGRAASNNDCKTDPSGSQTKSVNTKYRLFKSAGSLTNPKLEFVEEIGDASQIDTLRVADFNGDGLSDLAYVRFDDQWVYQLSNGKTLNSVKNSGLKTNDTKKLLTQFVDLNGDGRSDFMNASTTSNWSILFSEPGRDASTVEFTLRGSKDFSENSSVRFGDVNGDGKVDLLEGKSNGDWVVYTSRAGIKDYAINKITNGHGIYTSIYYAPMTRKRVYLFTANDNLVNSDSFTPVSGMQLVYRVATLSSDGKLDTSKSAYFFDQEGDVFKGFVKANSDPELIVNYQYGGLLIHKKGRGSLGFQMLRTLDAQTGVETLTQYNQDYGAEDFAKARMPISTRQSKSGQLLSKAVNTLSVKVTERLGKFPYVSKSEEYGYIYGTDLSSTHINTTTSANAYDSWGNLVESSIEVVDKATNEFIKTRTENTYYSGMSKRLGRLSGTNVTKSRTNKPSVTRNSSFTYYPNGMLSSSTIAEGTLAELTTSYHYDDYGNKTKTAIKGASTATGDIQTRITEVSFDNRGRYIDTKERYSDVGSKKIFSKTTYRYNGSPAASVTGIINSIEERDLNGQYSVKTLNDFGRVTQVTNNIDRSIILNDLSYCGDNVSTCSGIENAHYYELSKVISQDNSSYNVAPPKQVFYNKWGRVVAKRVLSFDGQWNEQRTVYDYRGRKQKEYEVSSQNYYTVTHYQDEGIGLVNSVTRNTIKGQTEVISRVEGLVTTTMDELGHQSIVYRNGFGEVAKTEDDAGSTVKFTYDSYGNLLESKMTTHGTNAGESVVSATYDSLGRKRTTTDPVKGNWAYTYNAFGEIYTQKNARNETFTYTYDEIGRKIKSYNVNEGTLCWFYGDDATKNNYGKLVKTAKFARTYKECSVNSAGDASIVKSYSYNSNGLSSEVKTEIDGSSYTQELTYDEFSRPSVTTYPAGVKGFATKSEYNTSGYLKLVKDNISGKVLKTITEMSVRNQVQKVILGNGIEVTNEYRADNGWLKSRKAFKAGSGTKLQIGLNYFNNGNVESRESIYDTTVGVENQFKEIYAYDELNRLTERTVKIVSGQSLPTLFKQEQSYQYDGWGNITFKSGVGFFKYDGNNPYKLLGIYKDENFSEENKGKVLSFAGSSGESFYDENGNITSDGNRNIVYSSFDKAESITTKDKQVSSVMKYGVNRELYSKDDCYTFEGVAV